jgi:hypothetical protein
MDKNGNVYVTVNGAEYRYHIPTHKIFFVCLEGWNNNVDADLDVTQLLVQELLEEILFAVACKEDAQEDALAA